MQKPPVSASIIVAVADLLGRFADDYQFDKSHPDYLGFLNVGYAYFLHEKDAQTWSHACDTDNREWVMAIVSALGMKIEGHLWLEETVFVKK